MALIAVRYGGKAVLLRTFEHNLTFTFLLLSLLLYFVTIALDIVDWDIEEIGEKAGFDIQYRYTGVNDPKDSSLACVTQFVGIYEDWSKLDRDLEVLIAAGIPRHLFKILTDNDDIDLKPVTQYLKAVS